MASLSPFFWVYIGLYSYGSKPINTIFRGMNIHLPAILMFTRGTRVLTHPHMWIPIISHQPGEIKAAFKARLGEGHGSSTKQLAGPSRKRESWPWGPRLWLWHIVIPKKIEKDQFVTIVVFWDFTFRSFWGLLCIYICMYVICIDTMTMIP